MAHTRQHDLLSADEHSVSGLTEGHVLQATGADSFGISALLGTTGTDFRFQLPDVGPILRSNGDHEFQVRDATDAFFADFICGMMQGDFVQLRARSTGFTASIFTQGDDQTESYDLYLPTAQASGTCVLQNDGAGILNWEPYIPVMPWSLAAGSPPSGITQLAVNHGYYTSNATYPVVYCLLPATAPVGSVIRVVGNDSTGIFRISQNALQYIHFGDIVTTTGVTGFLQSTGLRDSVELLCTVANVGWVVISSIGNFNVA